jgi:hypothetical protein
LVFLLQNDNSNEAEIQNVSENHKESILDKMNDELDVPGTVSKI